ncbi:ferritin [candidate division KSB1 bacterium]|nr:ferritin [candidate division KSB1 bacterium]NIR69630.1 ferritin [candidate division KSB1 bacterium]NIS25737.1 ferritin [candidate division KSB1 bacterium]NIT72604.1 ferritin [candidate division KSB1 bacterium]NIU26418.1 ferritin [candidate division KSB1 bacterium]
MNETVEAAINEQIKHELDSGYLYLSMAAYCESQNLGGFAHWMRLQFEEEVAHAMRLYNHIIDRGGRVILEAIDKPKAEFGAPLEIFEQVLAHEQKVTGLIHKLYELAVKENDYPVQVELQWFIEEQVEEEKKAGDIVDQLKLVGDSGTAIHRIDRMLAKRGSEK